MSNLKIGKKPPGAKYRTVIDAMEIIWDDDVVNISTCLDRWSEKEIKLTPTLMSAPQNMENIVSSGGFMILS